jgi:hypothetical protein
MNNEAIVRRLFAIFKDKYGETVCDCGSVFDGQRDLLEFVMGLGRAMEQMFFDGLGTGYVGPTIEIDGVRYRFKGYRSREVHGLFGKITLKRAYYVGGRGQTYCPLDRQLRLEGHTPGLQYFLALFTGQNVYQKALDQFQRIFRPEGKDRISMRKALDMDYELGEGLQGLRQKEIERVFEGEEPVEKQAPIAGMMAISIDATKVRQKLGEKLTKGGKKRYEIGFKDAKVAAVSSVLWDKQRGEASCVDSSYVCAVEEADEFFKRIWVEMQRRGVDPESQRLLFLGDGAAWIWNRTKDLGNKRSIEILDFYHACEYLSDLCKVLYGEQTQEYWRHFKGWTKMFYRSQAAAVIEALKEIQKNTRDEQTLKPLLLAIDHFQNNLPRMDYRLYRRLKLPIGSGTVESACKNVIGGRMKGGGMTWSDYGADGMLQIRSSQESDRFESDFRQLLAA